MASPSRAGKRQRDEAAAAPAVVRQPAIRMPRATWEKSIVQPELLLRAAASPSGAIMVLSMLLATELVSDVAFGSARLRRRRVPADVRVQRLAAMVAGQVRLADEALRTLVDWDHAPVHLELRDPPEKHGLLLHAAWQDAWMRQLEEDETSALEYHPTWGGLGDEPGAHAASGKRSRGKRGGGTPSASHDTSPPPSAWFDRWGGLSQRFQTKLQTLFVMLRGVELDWATLSGAQRRAGLRPESDGLRRLHEVGLHCADAFDTAAHGAFSAAHALVCVGPLVAYQAVTRLREEAAFVSRTSQHMRALLSAAEPIARARLLLASSGKGPQGQRLTPSLVMPESRRSAAAGASPSSSSSSAAAAGAAAPSASSDDTESEAMSGDEEDAEAAAAMERRDAVAMALRICGSAICADEDEDDGGDVLVMPEDARSGAAADAGGGGGGHDDHGDPEADDDTDDDWADTYEGTSGARRAGRGGGAAAAESDEDSPYGFGVFRLSGGGGPVLALGDRLVYLGSRPDLWGRLGAAKALIRAAQETPAMVTKRHVSSCGGAARAVEFALGRLKEMPPRPADAESESDDAADSDDFQPRPAKAAPRPGTDSEDDEMEEWEYADDAPAHFLVPMSGQTRPCRGLNHAAFLQQMDAAMRPPSSYHDLAGTRPAARPPAAPRPGTGDAGPACKGEAASSLPAELEALLAGTEAELQHGDGGSGDDMSVVDLCGAGDSHAPQDSSSSSSSSAVVGSAPGTEDTAAAIGPAAAPDGVAGPPPLPLAAPSAGEWGGPGWAEEVAEQNARVSAVLALHVRLQFEVSDVLRQPPPPGPNPWTTPGYGDPDSVALAPRAVPSASGQLVDSRALWDTLFRGATLVEPARMHWPLLGRNRVRSMASDKERRAWAIEAASTYFALGLPAAWAHEPIMWPFLVGSSPTCVHLACVVDDPCMVQVLVAHGACPDGSRPASGVGIDVPHHSVADRAWSLDEAAAMASLPLRLLHEPAGARSLGLGPMPKPWLDQYAQITILARFFNDIALSGTTPRPADAPDVTPAVTAACLGSVKAIRALSACSARTLDARVGCFGGKPIHFAAFFGHAEAVAVLQRCTTGGLNAPDYFSATPLLWAIAGEQTALALKILDAGGYTAEDGLLVAGTGRGRNARQRPQRRRARPSPPSNAGPGRGTGRRGMVAGAWVAPPRSYTPLMVACCMDNAAVVARMLALGADPHFCGPQLTGEKQPLDLAVLNGSAGALAVFLHRRDGKGRVRPEVTTTACEFFRLWAISAHTDSQAPVQGHVGAATDASTVLLVARAVLELLLISPFRRRGGQLGRDADPLLCDGLSKAVDHPAVAAALLPMRERPSLLGWYPTPGGPSADDVMRARRGAPSSLSTWVRRRRLSLWYRALLSSARRHKGKATSRCRKEVLLTHAKAAGRRVELCLNRGAGTTSADRSLARGFTRASLHEQRLAKVAKFLEAAEHRARTRPLRAGPVIMVDV